MSTAPLLSQHVISLAIDSGISPEVMTESGAYSVTNSSELRELGFNDRQAEQVPGLLFPYVTLGGLQAYRYRPDTPRLGADGKAIKYEQPAGSPLSLYATPSVREVLDDPKVPLWFTEGEKKAMAAASHGLACISLPGVWGWRGTNQHGGKAALPDFEAIALNGRTVRVCFDGDVVIKRGVQQSLARFVPFLESRGAKVQVVYLPPTEKLDDYLINHSPAELEALARTDRPAGLNDELVTDWQAALAEKDQIITTQRERINQQAAQLDLAAEMARENAAALGLVHAVIADRDKPMGPRLAYLSVWLEDRANPDRSWDFQPDLAAKVGMKSVNTFRTHLAPFLTTEGPVIKRDVGKWVDDPNAPNGRRYVERVRYQLRSSDPQEQLTGYLKVAIAPKERKPREKVDGADCLHPEQASWAAEVDRCTTCEKVLEVRPARLLKICAVGEPAYSPPDPAPSAPLRTSTAQILSSRGTEPIGPNDIDDLIHRHRAQCCETCRAPLPELHPDPHYCSFACAVAEPIEALA